MKKSFNVIKNLYKSRAIVYNNFGDPGQVLSMQYVTKPPLKPGEVLVKMRQSSINPSDLIPVCGAYQSRIKLPCIPGYEGFGYVVKHGKGVSFPHLGARVLALRGEGTWQDYVAIPAEEAIVVPNAINDDTAAQLYINPLTAWLMIKEKLKLKPGDTLAVNAAGSAFGNVVAKFSKIFGYNLISIVRNEFYRESLMESGEKFVINTEKVPLIQTVLDLTNNKGVTAALDAVGGESGATLVKCVKPGGIMLHYGLLSGISLPAEVFNTNVTGIAVENFWLREMLLGMDSRGRKKVFNEMMDAFIKYNISLSVSDRFDISNISQAVESAEKPNRRGKTMLVWNNVSSVQ